MATSRICSIPDCGKPHLARGWCGPHYERWRIHGDPEGGGTSPGEAFRYFSEVVLTYDGDDCLIWPFSTARGYGQLWFGGCQRYVHRLICENINGHPPTPAHEAAHSCGKGHMGCVTKNHLSWKTPAENTADKIVHGTLSRLTEADVLEIRSLRGVMPQKDIAERFGIGPSYVGQIQRRICWAWLA